MTDPDKLFGRLGNRMFQMAYIYSKMKDGEIPDIYIQDSTFFEKYQGEIRQWFGEGIGYLPYTAIHLRVGGNPKNPNEPKYTDNPFYVNLVATGYYIEAIKLFPHGKFLVFSDDMEFAKKYLEGDRFAFDESTSDIESFNLMASCQNHIIANSSFSAMAALCCPHLEQKNIYPSLWFSDNINRVKLPDTWIKL